MQLGHPQKQPEYPFPGTPVETELQTPCLGRGREAAAPATLSFLATFCSNFLPLPTLIYVLNQGYTRLYTVVNA